MKHPTIDDIIITNLQEIQQHRKAIKDLNDTIDDLKKSFCDSRIINRLRHERQVLKELIEEKITDTKKLEKQRVKFAAQENRKLLNELNLL